MVHWESYTRTLQDPVQHTSLILPSPPSLYHANIPDRHWQLRSLLCSPEPNVLYYPTGRNIYSLNTKTRKRELVASLPFSPTCIGVKYGWLCVGGKDQGYFASIKVGEPMLQTFPVNESEGMEIASVEAMLAEAKISELGGLIVNSITLHRSPGSKGDGDVLAILTNNDKTVRVFSLAQNRVQATLHLPISTNHASISPDGKHLVVVGDSTKVYFYHSSTGASAQHEAGREPWTLTRQLTAGTSDALISTAFSPSSVHCAVASQDGSITIFDTRFLSLSSDDGPSPIVKQIQSTRPRTHAGAIRSVQFSPTPWDLLVWAEHSGRVTVADVRSDFTERQVIDVLGNDENIVGVDVLGVSDHDAPSECRDQQTRRSHAWEQGESEEGATTGDALEGDLHGPLYSTSHGGWIPNPTVTTTVPYTTGSPPSSGHPRYYVRNTPSATFSPYVLTRSPTNITISTNDTSSNAQTGTQPLSPTSNISRDHRERRPENDVLIQQAHEQPRRQSPTDHMATPPARPPQHGTQISHDSQLSNITTDISNAAPNRPLHWRIDYDAQRRSAEEINQLQRNNEQLTQMIEEERRRNILRRTLLISGANRRSDANDHPTNEGHEALSRHQSGDCVDITGCTMSVDGSKLYVATSKGIVEYKVDLMRRRYFPSIKVR